MKVFKDLLITAKKTIVLLWACITRVDRFPSIESSVIDGVKKPGKSAAVKDTVNYFEQDELNREGFR